MLYDTKLILEDNGLPWSEYNRYHPLLFLNRTLLLLQEYFYRFLFSDIRAFVIHNDGLVRFEGKQYVFIQTEKNKFQMQEVTTANNENGFTQITFADSTDMRNKTFVTSGAYTLLMKMKNTEEEE